MSNRSQVLYVNRTYSESINVNAGVPQGSVLGPLLFLIMVNDLPRNITCDSLLFADDTTLFVTGREPQDISSIMNSAFNEAANWFEANGFKLNVNKTQNILFSPKNDDRSSSVKLLGIIFDSQLSWSEHIDHVCVRLSRVIYLLRQLKLCISNLYLKQAYYAFFHSVLSYGIHIWGNGQTQVD